MMIRFTAVSACALLTLSACSRDNQTAEPAPAPAMTAVETPAAPATPAVDPNVLTAEGLGAARIGMSKADLIAAWGDDANPDAVGGPEPDACDQFHPARAPQGVTVTLEGQPQARIPVAPDATQTQRLYLTAAPGTALAEGGQAELTLWVEDLGDGTRAHVDTVFHGRSEK